MLVVGSWSALVGLLLLFVLLFGVAFERIHPFIDGNGRTGRLLMWWHEHELGREPTLISYEDRHYYYAWFDPEPQETT